MGRWRYTVQVKIAGGGTLYRSKQQVEVHPTGQNGQVEVHCTGQNSRWRYTVQVKIADKGTPYRSKWAGGGILYRSK